MLNDPVSDADRIAKDYAGIIILGSWLTRFPPWLPACPEDDVDLYDAGRDRPGAAAFPSAEFGAGR